MDKLIELLFKHPILLFVVGAWLVGMLSNAAKAKKKASERREQQQRAKARAQTPQQRESAARAAAATAEGRRPELPEVGRSRSELPESGSSRPVMDPPPAARPAAPQQQSADDVAREMRRILGLDPNPPQPQPQSQPRPSGAAWPESQVAPPRQRPATVRPVEVHEPPRRRVGQPTEIHVDPHVGDGIRGRHIDRTGFTGRNVGRGFGSLGGRVKKAAPKRARAGARYSLDDLKTAFVMSEILSPPVSLRDYDSRRP